MSAPTDAAHVLTPAHCYPRRHSRRLWMLAALASVAFHGGVLAGLGLLGRVTVRSNASVQTPDLVPVELVEIIPSDSATAAASSLDENQPAPAAPSNEDGAGSINTDSAPEVLERLQSIAPLPATTDSEVAIAPIPNSSPTTPPPPEPPASPDPVKPSPEPSLSEPSVEPNTDVPMLPSPETAIVPPDVFQSNSASSSELPPLPALPSTVPGNPEPSPTESVPALPSIRIAETIEPVEITASVRVRTIDPGTESAADENAPEPSDRQTFTYDPTGRSGLAIAACPFVPEVHRFTGETVTVRVQFDDAGSIEAAQIYKSSIPSVAYETFAACLAKNWDFSRLSESLALNTEQLIVLVTVEETRG